MPRSITYLFVRASLLLVMFLFSFQGKSQLDSSAFVHKEMITWNDTVDMRFLRDSSLYTEQWDTLGQAKFWKQIMVLSPDSAIMNVAATREIIMKLNLREWHRQTDAEKDTFKANIRREHGFAKDERIFVTSGKNHFYKFEKTIPDIGRAIEAFESHGVDPFYCQTILLIESPGAHRSSSGVGAHGPFQLMKSVALKRGLRVDKYIDEREDIDKAAGAACKLLKLICIPETKKMLDKHNITYKETDIFFRLLVLHSYHAGSGNVRGVIETIQPTEGGIPLIRQVWRTEYKGFKNASQNYSQVALAALMSFDDLMGQNADTLFALEGDKLKNEFVTKTQYQADAFGQMDVLKNMVPKYRTDLIGKRISIAGFIERIQWAEQEIANLERMDTMPAIKAHVPLSTDEKLINKLGFELMKVRHYDDAIECFKYNVATHPKAWNTYDSLGYAYKKTGNKKLAIENYEKSVELNPKNSGGKAALEKLKG